jgi:calcineurin-like phosphoesterase family protein
MMNRCIRFFKHIDLRKISHRSLLTKFYAQKHLKRDGDFLCFQNLTATNGKIVVRVDSDTYIVGQVLAGSENISMFELLSTHLRFLRIAVVGDEYKVKETVKAYYDFTDARLKCVRHADTRSPVRHAPVRSRAVNVKVQSTVSVGL